MASSAFKSTSRRSGNTGRGSENSPKKVPIRRSHSVSAVSRAHHHQLDITSEFLNKRDNPLYWSNGSPPDKEIQLENSVVLAKFAENVTELSGSTLTSNTASADAQRERGRSVTRNSDVVNKKVAAGGRKDLAGRSLSRVDTGRRSRSLSRGHYATSEIEVERDSVISSNYGNRSSSNVAANSLKKANLGINSAISQKKAISAADMRRKSTQHQPIEPSDNSAVSPVEIRMSYLQIPNWEDGSSTGSLLEAEEKTIKAVCEQMKSFNGDHIGGGDTPANGIYETVRSEVKRAISDIQNDLESAIRRNNATAIASTNVADIPPDLVNPGAIELVLDIRREYARKLEESQERATKLRAELAVEEHRGQEFSRILKEILPDPKTTNVQKSRPGRKNSSERKKMSRRLTEEAMAYFDECVSISTFDSSDFSAPEDPPLNSIGVTTPAGGTASFARGSPSVSSSCCPSSCLNHKQESGAHMHSHMDSGLTASSSSNEPMMNQASLRGNNVEWGRKLQFGFSQKPTENVGLQQDIRNYIKKIEKEFDEDGINSENLRSNYYDIDEYLHGRSERESFLFDRVLLKNQIDSGSLHLCGGGLTVSSSSPFGSVI